MRITTSTMYFWPDNTSKVYIMEKVKPG